MKKNKSCDICGREYRARKYNKPGKYFNFIFCNRHRYQADNYNHVEFRTRFTPNDYIIKKNYIEIIAYKNNEKFIIKIDKEDFNKVKNYKWCIFQKIRKLKKSGEIKYSNYAFNRHFFMHNLIMNKSKNNFVIDHINRDSLDNRKKNLRICTQLINARNSSIRTDNKSGVPGVRYRKDRNKYVARLIIGRKNIFCKSFNTLEEAIKARKQAEILYRCEA